MSRPLGGSLDRLAIERERVSLCLSMMVAMSVPLKDSCTRSETTGQRHAVHAFSEIVHIVKATLNGL